MAIEVKHSGGAGAIAAAGFAGGQAKRQVQDTRVAVQLSEARKNRELQNKALANRAIEGQLNREFQEGQAERIAKRQTDRDERLWDELSERQRQQINDQADAYDDAVASGEYTEDELADIKRQMDAKRIGIASQSMPRAKPPSKWQPGQQPGDVWTTEDGTKLTRDDKGNVKPLPVSQREKGVADVYKSALERATNLESGVIDFNKVNEIVENFKKISGEAESSSGATDALKKDAPKPENLPTYSPAQAKELKPGTRFMGIDGEVYVK